jgi:hypothetical protein
MTIRAKPIRSLASRLEEADQSGCRDEVAPHRSMANRV